MRALTCLVLVLGLVAIAGAKKPSVKATVLVRIGFPGSLTDGHLIIAGGDGHKRLCWTMSCRRTSAGAGSAGQRGPQRRHARLAGRPPPQAKPESCTLKAEKGDHVRVHYTGTLEDGGWAARRLPCQAVS